MRIRTHAFVLIPSLLALNVAAAQVAPGDTLQLTWNGQTSRDVRAAPLGRLIPSAPDHR